MKKWLANLYYSFPMQLLILHLSSNLLLLGSWLLIGLLMTGQLARILGFKYLFLAPEYLGEIDFLSYSLLGLGFGGFYMTWNLTTYLLEAHRFPFLASLARPFTKYCLNNTLLPLIFLGIYLAYSVHFQLHYELWKIETILFNTAGFLSGMLLLVLMSVFYFHFTNKDVLSFIDLDEKEIVSLEEALAPGRRVPDLGTVRSASAQHRVRTYLSETLRLRPVRSVAHYDPGVIFRVFKQHHVNALIVQLLSLILLVILGLMIERAVFMVPAGTSIFILLSVFVSIVGSLTYWFHEWRVVVMVLLLASINYLTSKDLFHHRNKAYGLDYAQPPSPYNYETLGNILEPENVHSDMANTQVILENWKKKNSSIERRKPRMVMICVTGGGLRAAVWAMHAVAKSDQALNGQLMRHTTLITGSSGGIIGMSYLRELYYLQETLGGIDIQDTVHIEHISKDLLNAISFTLVSNDLFLPWARFQSGGYEYRKDRGYIFERQLNINTGYVMDKSLSDYREAEREAIIPMLFITPSIINDGRRLVISPHPVSYMMVAPIGVERPGTVEIDAIDFGRLFAGHDAYNLRFTSALRMNASFPYILPNVTLPTKPRIEVMDAGFRDNYGIMSATRFIHVFQDWIRENTSGVILLQIRGRDKFGVLDNPNQGVIESILNPVGLAGRVTDIQEFEHDSNLGYIFDLLGKEKFEIIRFTYEPSEHNERASVTFHLTEREKQDILDAFAIDKNQESLQRLRELFGK